MVLRLVQRFDRHGEARSRKKSRHDAQTAQPTRQLGSTAAHTANNNRGPNYDITAPQHHLFGTTTINHRRHHHCFRQLSRRRCLPSFPAQRSCQSARRPTCRTRLWLQLPSPTASATTPMATMSMWLSTTMNRAAMTRRSQAKKTT